MSTAALAQAPPPPPPPACPDPPAAYGGTDETIAELRALRTEAVETCVATIERLESVGSDVHDQVEDVDTLVAQGLAAADARDGQLDAIEDLHVDLTGPLDARLHEPDGTAIGPENPLAVHDANAPAPPEPVQPNGSTDDDPMFVRLASTDTAQPTIREGFNALNSGVWFLAGSMACMLIAGILIRLLMGRQA